MSNVVVLRAWCSFSLLTPSFQGYKLQGRCSLLAETWQLARGSSLWLVPDLPAHQPVEICLHFHTRHCWGPELLENLPLEATHAVTLIFEVPKTKNERARLTCSGNVQVHMKSLKKTPGDCSWSRQGCHQMTGSNRSVKSSKSIILRTQRSTFLAKAHRSFIRWEAILGSELAGGILYSD